jgi:hypothetical protein
MRPPKKTIAMLSGKYWKFFCNMKWMSKMPNAKTHSTKKIDIELLCSSSAEPMSGSTGSPGEVVVEVVFVMFAVDCSGVVDETTEIIELLLGSTAYTDGTAETLFLLSSSTLAICSFF